MNVTATVTRVVSVNGVESDRQVWSDELVRLGHEAIQLKNGFVHIGTHRWADGRTVQVTTFTVSGSSGDLREAAREARRRVQRCEDSLCLCSNIAELAAVVCDAAVEATAVELVALVEDHRRAILAG